TAACSSRRSPPPRRPPLPYTTLFRSHSMGGSEAFRLAYRRPDLVRGMISIEGGPTEAAVTPAFKRALRFAPWTKLFGGVKLVRRDRKSTRLNSSHVSISYAVFCLKKK